MKKTVLTCLALAGLSAFSTAHAINLDDILIWTGSGTNRAAVVVEWSAPQALNQTTVPAPLTDKTMAWGYRFNGSATASQMFNAILAADLRLYAVESTDYGTFVEGIGYNLTGNQSYGLTDGTNTYNSSDFTNDCLINPNLDVDAAYPLDNGDLYWGGYNGPNWEVWNELGDNGGFTASPNRGTNPYWTPDDPLNPYSGSQGQWQYSEGGLDDLILTNGSWIGFSVASGGDDYSNTNDPGTIAFGLDKHAPPSPDGTYAAYIYNTNDFAAEVVSSTNLAGAPYNDPTAILGRPALEFLDHYGDGTDHRVKIIEAPYWKAPDGSNVITEISSGGQVTVNMGRKVYDDPNNPYGIDLIVYGNSFFSAFGFSGSEVNDSTDLNEATLSSGIFGHSTTVSVSQDGTNWFAFTNTPALFPDNAYRWDDTNDSWTEEEMNPTKPLNPSVYGTDFAGQTVAGGLDQFLGSSGGTGYDLKTVGLPWVQYVRVEPGPGVYTVIDAIAAANPTLEGDALSITPDDITSGLTNLLFQSPANIGQNLVTLEFHSVSDMAKVGAVGLSDLSSYAPVAGKVLSAYQVRAALVTGTNTLSFLVDLELNVGMNYQGAGNDLRVWQWNGTNWISPASNFSIVNNKVTVAGLTNLSTFVVAQLVAPQLVIQMGAGGYNFEFTPVAHVAYILERSTNLVTWSQVASVTPANTQPVSLQDTAQPSQQAFYRLLVNWQ